MNGAIKFDTFKQSLASISRGSQLGGSQMGGVSPVNGSQTKINTSAVN